MSTNFGSNRGCKAVRRTWLVLSALVVTLFGALSHADDVSFASDSAEFAAVAMPAVAPATEIQLVEKDTDVFYLQAKLGDNAASEFLFDTGSGYLAINEEVLGRLKSGGQAEYLRSIRARLASGAVSSVAVYSIASLDLGSGCVLRDVEAAILPGSTRNILGMNVLKMVDSFSVSFEPAKLVLSGCSQQPASNTVAAL